MFPGDRRHGPSYARAMTEPDATEDTPIVKAVKGAVGDILDGTDDPTAAPADPQPASGSGGVFGGGAIGGLAGSAAGGLLKGLLVDRDKDGIIDVFEAGSVTKVRDDVKVEDFLKGALAQIGDKYQRGVENRFDNADPSKWDGSELVEWAANRAGVQLQDGPTNQYRQMVGKGGGLDIDDALHTPGAILYEFNRDPINGSPSRASTAISLGDGRILEIDPKEGVRIVDAKGMHFTHAAVIPGLTDAHEPGAGALDVVHQALVQHGIEEAAPPVEDTPEIAALAARAAELRAKYVETSYGEGRAERLQHRSDLERGQKLAEAGLQLANDDAVKRQKDADAKVEDISKLNAQADAAEARGDRSGAQELREEASSRLALAQSDQSAADHAKAEAAKYQQQIDVAKAEIGKIEEGKSDRQQLNFAGEPALDQLENKVALMRAANGQAALVTDLERRESEARVAGNTAQADQLAKQVQSARTTAERMQQSADAVTVDESTLQQIQDLPAPLGASAAPPAGEQAPDASPDTAPKPDDHGAPDTQEITELADRAAQLREHALETIRHDFVESEQRHQAVQMEKLAAENLVTNLQGQAQERREQLEADRQQEADLTRQAADAEAKGDLRTAEEVREQVARVHAAVEAGEDVVASTDAAVQRTTTQASELQQRLVAVEAEYKAHTVKLNDAEDAIDAIENRVRALGEVKTQTTLAEDLDRQAASARAAGNPTEAQRLTDEAATHRTAAQTAQTQLDAIKVDEAALAVLDGGSITPKATAEQPSTSDASDDRARTEATGLTGDGVATAPGPDADAIGTATGDLVGDIETVAPAAATATAAAAVEDSSAPAADPVVNPDVSAGVTATADGSAGFVADTPLDDASAGMHDIAAAPEPAPTVDTTTDDEV